MWQEHVQENSLWTLKYIQCGEQFHTWNALFSVIQLYSKPLINHMQKFRIEVT